MLLAAQISHLLFHTCALQLDIEVNPCECSAIIMANLDYKHPYHLVMVGRFKNGLQYF